MIRAPEIKIACKARNNDILTLYLHPDKLFNNPDRRRNNRVGDYIRPYHGGVEIPYFNGKYKYVEPVPSDAKIRPNTHYGTAPDEVFTVGTIVPNYKLHGTNPANNIFIILIEVQEEDEYVGTRTDYVLGFKQGLKYYFFHAMCSNFEYGHPRHSGASRMKIKPYRGFNAFYLDDMDSDIRYGLYFIGRDKFIIGWYNRFENVFHPQCI